MLELHLKIKLAATKRCFALTVGGDHSIATGTISGLKAVYPNLKVMWLSANADCVIPEFT